MNRLLLARLILAGMALVVWGYGVRADEPRTRVVGIALFVIALLLRFAVRRDGGDRPTDAA